MCTADATNCALCQVWLLLRLLLLPPPPLPLRLLLPQCVSSDNMPYCTEYLRWDVRRKALMEVVRELDADILCLQEVDNYSHFWVKELQHLGYTGNFLLLRCVVAGK